MRTLTAWLAAASAASLMLSSSGAFAQAHGEWEPMSQGHRLGGEYDLWPTDSFTVMSWAFVGQIEVIDHLMIDFDLPWAFGTFDFGGGGFGGSDSAFTLGNPS